MDPGGVGALSLPCLREAAIQGIEAIVTPAESEWSEVMRLKLQERSELKFKSRIIP